MGLQDFISCLSVCLLLVRCGIAINIPENSDIHLHSMSTAFDENRMQILAELAGVSYCPTATIEDWSCTYCRNSGLQLEGGLVRVIGKSLVQANATRVVVGKLDGEDNCFLSFRGSSVSSNYVADFSGVQVHPPAHSFPGCEGCSVHAGFLLIWETLEADIKSTLSEFGCGPTSSQGLVVTGHSLGAASAHLAMYALHHAGFRIAEAYTFESPRSGNKAFSTQFSKLFHSRIPMYRLTHNRDVVPHLPPALGGWVHVPQEVFYSYGADGVVQHHVCDDEEGEDDQCAKQVNPIRLSISDHCSVPWVQTGNMCDNCSSATRVQLTESARIIRQVEN